MNKKPQDGIPRPLDKIVITEGIHGLYHYHLSTHDKCSKSLCGKDTMQTSLSLAAWGYKGHLKERYCDECIRLSGLEL